MEAESTRAREARASASASASAFDAAQPQLLAAHPPAAGGAASTAVSSTGAGTAPEAPAAVPAAAASTDPARGRASASSHSHSAPGLAEAMARQQQQMALEGARLREALTLTGTALPHEAADGGLLLRATEATAAAGAGSDASLDSAGDLLTSIRQADGSGSGASQLDIAAAMADTRRMLATLGVRVDA